MFIEANDAQLFTVGFGGGEHTLVALGGWAGSWELWAEPFTYLSASWRTVGFDHRGTGTTIAPVDTIRIETLVQDVFVVLDKLKIDQCVLAAESAGAAIVLMAALQQPQRFSGLVLVDGVYYQPVPEKPDPFLLGLKSNFQATIHYFVDTCTPEPNSDAVRHWGRQILARSQPEAAIQLYECMVGVDLRSQVKQIAQPTLILHGEHDRIMPLSSSEWLATQIPQSQLQVLAGAGHVPTVTRPREVAEAINRYFSR
jgi:sigma-B regulation protein RsbQ